MIERYKPPASKIFDLDLANPHVRETAKFLCKFGYLDPKVMEERKALGEALRIYQRFYQLEPTGELTLETIKQMRRPRCGNPDPVQPLVTDGTAKADPIVYFGGRWDHRNITYFIDNFTADMTGEAGVVQDAFDVWADVTPLSFTRIFDSNAADIIVSWETFNHGDGNAFDGVQAPSSISMIARPGAPPDQAIRTYRVWRSTRLATRWGLAILVRTTQSCSPRTMASNETCTNWTSRVFVAAIPKS